jgi:hypothetical protein
MDISNHTVCVGGNEPAGEPDGVVQRETSDLGDEDLDGGLFERFLLCHPFPRECCDDAVLVDGSSALGVVLVIVTRTDLEVHLLPLCRDLARDENLCTLEE